MRLTRDHTEECRELHEADEPFVCKCGAYSVEALSAQTKPEKYVCPACKNRGEFLKGPEGGLSINIQCVKCGNRWNDMPGLPLEWIGHRDTAKLAERTQAAQPCRDIACPDERQYGDVHPAPQPEVHCEGWRWEYVPVVCADYEAPFRLRLWIGNQGFEINDIHENREHAEWTAQMMDKALARLTAQPPAEDVAGWLRDRAKEADSFNEGGLGIEAGALREAASAWEERTRGGGAR